MPGDLTIPFNGNQPDSGLTLASPPIHNFQIIDPNSNALEDIVKRNEGLVGALDAMRVNLTASEMQQIFPDPKGSKEKIDAFEVVRETVRELLNEWMPAFGLTNLTLVSEFLGQVKVETNGLQDFEEGLNYIAHIDPKTHQESLVNGLTAAQRIAKTFSTHFPYAIKDGKIIYSPNNPQDYVTHNAQDSESKRLALGNLVYQGYWGRGLLQVSLEGNYAAFTAYMNQKPYEWNINFATPQNRDLIKTNLTDAVVSGLWFFKTHVIDQLNMQKATITDITGKINPHLLQWQQRINDTHAASGALQNGALKPTFKQPDFSKFHNYLRHHPIHQNTPSTVPILHPATFNTTPAGIGNSSVPSTARPVIQNVTINNTTNSTISRADIQKHVADLLTAAVADAHIGTTA